MKVIGSGGNGKYICEVSHLELEKFLDLYYGKQKRLEVGDEVDLSKGYNHAADVEKALQSTRSFIQDNQATVTAIINGLRIESAQG